MYVPCYMACNKRRAQIIIEIIFDVKFHAFSHKNWPRTRILLYILDVMKNKQTSNVVCSLALAGWMSIHTHTYWTLAAVVFIECLIVACYRHNLTTLRTYSDITLRFMGNSSFVRAFGVPWITSAYQMRKARHNQRETKLSDARFK